MKIRTAVVALAATALVAMAGPASAAPPYTVSVNGDTTNGTHAYTASSTGPVTLQAGSTTITCSSVLINGSILSGRSVANPVASAATSTWGGCVSGGAATISPDHTPTWSLNATGTATNANTDDIVGNVGNVRLSASIMGGACSFSMTGSADDIFHETTQTIQVNESSGHMLVSSVSGFCFGDVASGDVVTMTGTFAVSSSGSVYFTYAPYQASANGDTGGTDHSYTASSSGPVTLTVHGTGGGPMIVTCSSVQISGYLHTGSTGVNPYASITGSAWNGCSGPATLTADHSSAWQLRGTGAATSGTSDDIAGSMDGVNFAMSASGGLCVFNVTGTAADVLHEASQSLAIDEHLGGLTVNSANPGCLGTVSDADVVDLLGSFSLTTGGPFYLS